MLEEDGEEGAPKAKARAIKPAAEAPVVKKPAAASHASYFHNATRRCFVVKSGVGKGSTKTISYGPKKLYTTAAAAEAEAKRLTEI